MNKYKILSLTALVMMLFSMVFAAAGPAAAADKQITRADVFAFDPFPAVGQQVPEAWAKLTTDENGAGLLMQTSNLIPGDAVTIWWIIFNYPEECAAFPGGSCGLADLENPAVAPEILYATGAVINNNGKAHFAAQLGAGHTAREWFGNGLINPEGAEIHVISHSHGQAIPGLVDNMISTYRGGCMDDDFIAPGHPAYEDGIPGPNQCVDLQFAVFQQ
jgi:hypothetical protein